MEDNILSDFLGLDLVKLKEISAEKKQAELELAIAIDKLTEYPEWKVYAEQLEILLKNIDKPCEFYSDKPDMAKYDAGIKRGLNIIKGFVEKQKRLIEYYAKENSRKASEGSEQVN